MFFDAVPKHIVGKLKLKWGLLVCPLIQWLLQQHLRKYAFGFFCSPVPSLCLDCRHLARFKIGKKSNFLANQEQGTFPQMPALPSKPPPSFPTPVQQKWTCPLTYLEYWWALTHMVRKNNNFQTLGNPSANL